MIGNPLTCTGCGACLNQCPKQSIVMEADVLGFGYPKVNEQRCIKCGECERVCPSIVAPLDMDRRKEPEVYAAWSLDETIRLQSTSGGVFSELACLVLDGGGYVCGARYNEMHLVEHFIINKKQDLWKLRQSKYVQSDIGHSLISIKILLEHGDTVLFCGSPCQGAGLLSFLGKKYEKLIIVDFICRGANSPLVYRRFLKELEQIYNSEVERVWFKNKTYGWKNFSTQITLKNGEIYLKDRYSDLYIKGYIQANLYMRHCCSSCEFKGLPRLSDMTLADFWGIELKDKKQDTDKGTSMILINSEKGQQLFEQIIPNIFYERKTLQEAEKRNPCLTQSIRHNPEKHLFERDLEEMSILKNIERFCKTNKN